MKRRRRSSARREAGFSLVELVIAVSVLVILTGAMSPVFVRYIEKGRQNRDKKNIEMVYTALAGALNDEAAYDAFVSASNEGGLYGGVCAFGDILSQDDAFADAVRVYMEQAPKLASKEAGGDGNQIMVSMREGRNPDTGIREVRIGVWAGDYGRTAGEDYCEGVMPEELE